MQHAFLREPGGRFITVDPPGATNTVASGISPDGIVVGYFLASTPGQHGFLRLPNGALVQIDVTGALDTSLLAINAKHQVAGNENQPLGIYESLLFQIAP